MSVTVRQIQIANTTPDDRTEIEALAKVKSDYDKAKKLVKNYDDRLKVLKDRNSDFPLDYARIVPGDTHNLEISEGSQERSVKDIKRLIEILGEEVFLQICKVNIGDIDKYVPEHLHSEVLTVERGTKRTVKLVKRNP